MSVKDEIIDIIENVYDNGYAYDEDGYEITGYANSINIAEALYAADYRKASEVRAETVREMVEKFKKPFAETEELCSDDPSDYLVPASLVLSLLDKVAKDVLEGEK